MKPAPKRPAGVVAALVAGGTAPSTPTVRTRSAAPSRASARTAGDALVAPFALASLLALTFLPAAAADLVGIPPAYAPIVVEPTIAAGHVEFDLAPAIARAKRENRRLYVYLGASDCPYCRRYEAFLRENAGALVPRFKPWIVVDLHSSLSTTARQLYLRTGGGDAVSYTDFQRAIGDERARMLVYPSVWLFDPQLKPLMQMPAGTGTFQTVDEQLEILDLVQ